MARVIMTILKVIVAVPQLLDLSLRGGQVLLQVPNTCGATVSNRCQMQRARDRERTYDLGVSLSNIAMHDSHLLCARLEGGLHCGEGGPQAVDLLHRRLIPLPVFHYCPHQVTDLLAAAFTGVCGGREGSSAAPRAAI